MKTFFGEYSGGNFVMSGDNEVLRAMLISILNTPIGSRFYYPSYGSRLNELKFSVLNHFTINMIGQEVKNAVGLMDGVSLSSIEYTIDNDTIHFTIGLNRLSNNITVNLSVADGVAF